MAASASRKVIFAALAGNSLIAVTKFAAAAKMTLLDDNIDAVLHRAIPN